MLLAEISTVAQINAPAMSQLWKTAREARLGVERGLVATDQEVDIQIVGGGRI